MTTKKILDVRLIIVAHKFSQVGPSILKGFEDPQEFSRVRYHLILKDVDTTNSETLKDSINKILGDYMPSTPYRVGTNSDSKFNPKTGEWAEQGFYAFKLESPSEPAFTKPYGVLYWNAFIKAEASYYLAPIF